MRLINRAAALVASVALSLGLAACTKDDAVDLACIAEDLAFAKLQQRFTKRQADPLFVAAAEATHLRLRARYCAGSILVETSPAIADLREAARLYTTGGQ